MTEIEKINELNRKLSSILDAEYDREDRPTLLLDILTSVSFINMYLVQYTHAKRDTKQSIWDINSAQDLFVKSKLSLIAQLHECLATPQVFKEHGFYKEMQPILEGMHQLANQLSLENIPSSPITTQHMSIEKNRNERGGSLSSSGSTTTETTTPDSKNIKPGMPPSSFKLNS
jgi:hypothetical protein